MLSAVVLPERGAMNAVTVSSHEANRAGPRPEGRLRSPSSSPVSPAGSVRGLAPLSDGRSLIAVSAARTGVSGLICGLTASAATGSPGRGMRAAMTRQAVIPAAMTAQASTRSITATRRVGVPGHAWPVRNRTRLMTHRSLNGGTRRPASTAASRAASQASQAAAIRLQARSKMIHTPAPFPARTGTRGRTALAIDADRLVCVVEVVFVADQGQLDRDPEPFPGLDEVFPAAGVPGAGLP